MALITSRSRTSGARMAAPLGVAAALLATLSGCATAVDTGTGTGTDAGTQPESETPADATYRNGSFQANGTYQSPNGSENIIVVLELENNLVTDVEIIVNPNNPTTANYQGRFADGIGDIVIGEDINSLDVTVVAGSSLTGNGFREALNAIKADALES